MTMNQISIEFYLFDKEFDVNGHFLMYKNDGFYKLVENIMFVMIESIQT